MNRRRTGNIDQKEVIGMRLYARQKYFSFRTVFSILDSNGRVCYTVKGEIFSLTKKLHVYDNTGREVAILRGRIIKLLPTYDIFIGGRKAASIAKRLTLFRPSYVIRDSNWRVEGDFLQHRYSMYDGRRNKVASISKKWLTFGDCFELNVPDPDNEVLAVCMMLAIDCVMDDQEMSSLSQRHAPQNNENND